MSKTLCLVFVTLCLAYTATCACDDGYFAPENDAARTALGLATDDAECVACDAGCRACDELGECTDLDDRVDGADINSAGVITAKCGVTPNIFAYNKDSDTCDMCMEGCSSCLYDYDYCASCKTGWDYNRGDRACLRATLGLTAVNFVLSVIILAAGIFTCIKASKLS